MKIKSIDARFVNFSANDSMSALKFGDRTNLGVNYVSGWDPEKGFFEMQFTLLFSEHKIVIFHSIHRIVIDQEGASLSIGDLSKNNDFIGAGNKTCDIIVQIANSFLINTPLGALPFPSNSLRETFQQTLLRDTAVTG